MACRYHSEVTFLHVVLKNDYPWAWMDVPVDPAWWAACVSDARKQLESVLVDEFRGMAINRIIVEGDPAMEIVEFARSNRTNLIVMPTHGYGPFRRFIIGSVTARVLDDADCPVLTGVHMKREMLSDPVPFRNILCAVDLGLHSEALLGWAAQLAADFGAHLHLVHALPPIDAGQARYFDQDWLLDLDRAAREQLNRLQEKTGTKANVVVHSGEVAKVIRSAAEFAQADLVVIGRHADSGILGRLRTHVYSTVRESPCPVASV
jgi:nucleotide-binding universal stress UspA family protein